MEKIQVFSHLQKFFFHVGCTTEIIVELSKYCPHLKIISVTNSRGLEGDCVEHLLKLRHLHTLNVAGTSLSYVNYEALLSGLPHLQGIFWFDPIDPVLLNLPACLPSVTTFYGKISDADLLVQKCPNLNEVMLISFIGDISTLGQVRSIVDITLYNSCWITIGFSNVIRSLGATLTALEFHGAENISVDDLCHYCTVLISLMFDYCHMTNTKVLDWKLPHFNNLKRLILKRNNGLYDFTSILHKYVNLMEFHAADMEAVTDALIRQIVTAGGFRRLIVFSVHRCGHMSINTAWLLVQNCSKLTELGNICSWSAVRTDEVETFLSFVRYNNLPLTVHP
jgi:hypothetical protein